VKLPNIARSRLVAGALISLLVILVLELALSVRRETQTWDEACHIFAGYRYWTRGDFGMNPEAPNSMQRRMTAGSSLAETTVTGTLGY